MTALADRFTVYALDTPGYGMSAPLAMAQPSIPDFAAALGSALAVLGLDGATVYATHTSAKIALALAARGGRMQRLVLDGLSIPGQPAPPEFIASYMRPFVIDDAGAYLAAEWSRTRDMLRWFPWFTPAPAARTTAPAPSPEWMADYGVDLFSAGPAYADAYAAAMRWDPMADLLAVRVRTLVGARSDDVLFGFLDRVPVAANPALSVVRLGADRAEWLAWLGEALGAVESSPPTTDVHAARDRGYIDLAHGQLHWQRFVSTGTADRPSGATILALSAPTTLQARAWAAALAPHGTTLVPDLPGFGESDSLPWPDADGIADALAALLAAQASGAVTVLGIGIAAPLAARLAARHPEQVRRLVIDGAPPLDPVASQRFGDGLCPDIAFDAHAGTHLHHIWHMLRDGEAQWPWHDCAYESARLLPPLLGGEGLHAALTGVLKQPRDWGQAARAALAAGRTTDWSQVTVPATIFTHADPAYADSAALAAAIPDARTVARSDMMNEAARSLLLEEH